MTDATTSDVPAPQNNGSPAPVYALIAAALLLTIYLGMTVVMFWLFSEKDNQHWQNALTIYNGFQAFATAAGGLLLGTTIQRARVAAAEQHATQAKTESIASRAKLDALRDTLSADAGAGGGDAAASLDAARRILG
jgi:hypothetical protein